MNDAQADLSVTVGEFIRQSPARLALRVLENENCLSTRRITVPRIQKLGLALAGFSHYIHPGRVQIVGQSEIQYLNELSPNAGREALARLELTRIACVLITKNLEPPVEFTDAARSAGLPVLQTPLVSSAAITIVSELLQRSLAPREMRHGVLLDLYGLGVLLEGRSGIGKSECALDLIARGHRLVADDAVEVRRIGDGELVGSAPEMLRGMMEIRGLGIVNIADVYGVSAISDIVQVQLIVCLETWDERREIDRLGLDARTTDVLGVHVPHILLPVSSGRNLSTLVDAAVRFHLLRMRGRDAAHKFVEHHTMLLAGEAETVSTNGREDFYEADAKT